jgi:hypothetical protein
MIMMDVLNTRKIVLADKNILDICLKIANILVVVTETM